MNILHVIPSFPPAIGYGGGPKVAYEISKRLVLRGHKVNVFTTDADSLSDRIKTKYDEIDGIKVHYFSNVHNGIAYKKKLFFSPTMIFEASKTIRKYDIIHLHDLRTFQNILMYPFIKGNSIPYFIQPHGVIPYGKDGRLIKKTFDNLIGKRLLREASGILALNSTELEQILSYGVKSERVNILPNGISASEAPKAVRGLFRTEFSISQNNKLILYLGRLHHSKRIDLLIRAINKLKRKDEVILAIIGPNDGCLDYLKNIGNELGLSKNIIFVDYIEGRLKASAYSDCDVFVTPSFQGFPLTFLEAMLYKAPIVTTNCADVIQNMHMEFGIIADCTPEDIANKIDLLLSDLKLSTFIKSNAYKKLLNSFDWDNIVNIIEDLYEKSRI